MKKKTILLAGLAAALVLAGCGGAADTESASSKSAAGSPDMAEAGTDGAGSAEEAEDPIMSIPTISGEFSLEDCVKLGEYKGLDLTLEVEEVTDDYLDTYISYLLDPVETDDPDAAVAEGDVVNIDYEGKLDGEAFDGGTAQGYDLEIGSGTFIPGFEDGLIGMKKGETKDLELTFPESYVEDLAGKDVVFTVTVNAIKQKPELDDAWVENYTDGAMKTVDEFKESTRKDLEDQNREYAESMLKNDAWQQVLDNSEILAFPEEYLQQIAEQFDNYINEEAQMYGMELEDYLAEMGMTQESYESYRESVARDNVKTRLVTEALAEAEGVTTDSEEFQAAAADMEEYYGMSVDELRENYGADEIDQYLISDILMDRILSYANVTETKSEEG